MRRCTAWKFPSGRPLMGWLGKPTGCREARRGGSDRAGEPGVGHRQPGVVTTGSDFDLTTRARFDPHNRMSVTFADAMAQYRPAVAAADGGLYPQLDQPVLHLRLRAYRVVMGGDGRPSSRPTEPYPAPRDEISIGRAHTTGSGASPARRGPTCGPTRWTRSPSRRL